MGIALASMLITITNIDEVVKSPKSSIAVIPAKAGI
jgi:hypothetical protein